MTKASSQDSSRAKSPSLESPLATALSQLRRAIEQLKLSENDWNTLSTPRRILEVAVPLRRDDGRVEMYKGNIQQPAGLLRAELDSIKISI
jgi:hypothetical protein